MCRGHAPGIAVRSTGWPDTAPMATGGDTGQATAYLAALSLDVIRGNHGGAANIDHVATHGYGQQGDLGLPTLSSLETAGHTVSIDLSQTQRIRSAIADQTRRCLAAEGTPSASTLILGLAAGLAEPMAWATPASGRRGCGYPSRTTLSRATPKGMPIERPDLVLTVNRWVRDFRYCPRCR